MNRRRAVYGGITLGIVAALALALTSSLGSTPGCGPAQPVAEKDQSFTPWEGRFGYAPERPLARTGTLVEANSVADLLPFRPATPELRPPVQAQLFQNVDDFNGDGLTEPGVVSYYSTSPWSNHTGFSAFIEGGGVIFSQRQAGGFDAELIVSQVGSRATLVQIGPHTAALTHADPISDKGTRPYYLTWSDGTTDAQLIADLPATELIDAARSIYCQGG